MAGSSYKGSNIESVDQFLDDAAGLGSEREQEIGQHIGYRYDVNLVPDYQRLTPFLKDYIEFMGAAMLSGPCGRFTAGRG